MPMTQDDIRRHYESNWKSTSDAARTTDGLGYSSPVEDGVLYPIYLKLIRDLGIRASGGRVLDVGSGSGRWVRFFTEQLTPPPRELIGVDYTQAAVELLNKWHAQLPSGLTHIAFARADITDSALKLDAGTGFDLINIANVLFHIPEPDKFKAALANLHRLVTPDGHIVTTEYLPRATLRSEWMLVRSRYEFQIAVEQAGLRIVDIRACSFFSNDPAGIDGPDLHSPAQGTTLPQLATRGRFAKVRAMQQKLLASPMDDAARGFFRDLFIEIDRATLEFMNERIAPIDGPAQKLVVLARA